MITTDTSAAYVQSRIPTKVRWQVFERDLGVCAHCGLDTAKMAGFVYWWKGWLGEYIARHQKDKRCFRTVLDWPSTPALAKSLGIPAWPNDGWHCQAISQERSLRDLENLETVCAACRKFSLRESSKKIVAP